MKKLIALLLALLMVFAAATVFAADSPVKPEPKPADDDTTQTTTATTPKEEKEEPVILIVPDTEAAVNDMKDLTDRVANGEKAIDLFGEEAKEELAKTLPEDAELIEHASLAINPDADLTGVTNVKLDVEFNTPFAQDDKVTAVLQVFDENGEAKIFVLPGTVDEKGNVSFNFDRAMIDAMNGAPANVLVVLAGKEGQAGQAIIIVVDDTELVVADMQNLNERAANGEKAADLFAGADVPADAELADHLSLAINPDADLTDVTGESKALTFGVQFAEGDAVTGVLKTFKDEAGESTELNVLPGTVNSDGTVTFDFSRALIDLMNGAPANEFCVVK